MAQNGLEVVYDEDVLSAIRTLAAGAGVGVHTDPAGRILGRVEREEDREVERRSIPVPRMGFGDAR